MSRSKFARFDKDLTGRLDVWNVVKCMVSWPKNQTSRHYRDHPDGLVKFQKFTSKKLFYGVCLYPFPRSRKGV